MAIPEDSLAFQLGEVLQIISGGSLVATPHVVKNSGRHTTTSRNTMAVFMDFTQDTLLQTYGENPEQVYTKFSKAVTLENRWKPGMTCGDFHKATLNYYAELRKSS